MSVEKITFRAELSINRLSGGKKEDLPMRITIEDATSGCHVLEAYFSLEGFMKALTAQSAIDGEGILWAGVPIGYTQQTKTEIVPKPKTLAREGNKEASRLVAPFEVDGWRGDISDVHNHHRWTGDGVAVLFRRYVNDEGHVWGQGK